MYDFPQDQISGLKLYKYSAVDLSVIRRMFTNEFYEFLVKFIPATVAPNAITITGFAVILLNTLLIGCESQLKYYSFAAALFVYQTLDNLDGKQARRTNSSSALGELFDHGLDALNCTFGLLLQADGLKLDNNFTFLIVATAATCFFFSTWETFYTGTLYLDYINGPNEGVFMGVFMLLLAGNGWKANQDSGLGIEGLTQGMCVVILMVILAITCHIPGCVSRVVTRNAKKTSPRLAIYSLLPYLFFIFVSFLWLWLSIFKGDKVLFTLFLVGWGLALGKICSLITISHVTNYEYPSIKRIIIPFVFGLYISIFGLLLDSKVVLKLETMYIYMFSTFFIVDYCLFSYFTIRQFCNFLGIQCFSIKYQSLDASDLA
jgi:ethanolaminephosphotransferase